MDLMLRRRLMMLKKEEPNALKFTPESDSYIYMSIGSNLSLNLYYSVNGRDWNQWAGERIYITAGHSVYIKGNNPNGFSVGSSIADYAVFGTGEVNFELHGNVMSLLGEDITDIPNDYCFYYLFSGCHITTAPELPSLTLKAHCYQNMFLNCRQLITPPVLPATVLVDSCYHSIFRGCISLTSTPELHSISLAYECYLGMFWDCSSITVAPVLPATTLYRSCYQEMFCGCSNLLESPILLAETLVTRCYYGMFQNCTKINKITCLATDISAFFCTQQWTRNTPQDGTFIKNSTMENWGAGENGIPVGWNIIDY